MKKSTTTTTTTETNYKYYKYYMHSSSSTLNKTNNMCNANRQRRRRSMIEAEASIAFLEEFHSSNLSKKTKSKTKPSRSTSTKSKNKKGPTKRREIQHNYHDHANDNDALYQHISTVAKGGVTAPFPLKLHHMLDHIAQHEPSLSNIVTWQPHGRSFIVHNMNKFAEDILPRFFDQRKYASFQRQLNLYGFTRLTRGPDRGSYYHELFLRSRRILCRGIVRMKVKGTGARMANNPEQEPNFYQMTFMPVSSPENEDTSTTTTTTTTTIPPPHPNPNVKSLDLNLNLNRVKDETEDISVVHPMPVSVSVPTITVSSSGDEHGHEHGHEHEHEQAPSSSNKPIAIASQSCSILNHPRETTSTQNDYVDVNVDEDMKTIDLVFENMPFHGLDSSECSRRHSLMSIQQRARSSISSAQFVTNYRRGSSSSSLRNSFLLLGGSSEGQRRSSCVMSIILGDDDFEKDMEAICQLGEKVFADQEMSGVLLDKIM